MSVAVRTLDRIERLGNRLPEPLTIFVLFALAVPLISAAVSVLGWEVEHPGTGQTIEPVNLLSVHHIRRMFTDAVKNFTDFPPLGTVLVAMIGIGVAERSGLVAGLLKMTVTFVPRGLTTAALVFCGVMSSMAADAGYVVLTPLGAVLFAGLGRHPLAGLAAAYAGVTGGFSANLLLTMLDPLLGGFTESAAQLLDGGYKVPATANYAFMIVSTFLVTTIGWLVTEKIVEPRLGAWQQSDQDDHGIEIRRVELAAAFFALVCFVIVAGAFAVLTLPSVGLFRSEDGGLGSLYASLVPVIAIAFFVPGLVYGLVTGTIRSDRAVVRMTGDAMATMGTYIVLAFVAAQFVAYFDWSNLGVMLAVSGAELLKTSSIEGLPLILSFILVAALLNLFIASASAKWAIMAPVFVPMMMLLGLSPEMTQCAYRIGDSVTNMITPLMAYLPIIIAFGQRYQPDLRLGTLIATMLPYSIAFAIGWVLLLVVWYVAGWPLGPGAPIHYQPV